MISKSILSQNPVVLSQPTPSNLNPAGFSMKKLTVFLLVTFLAAASSRATIAWQELFNYADGPIIVNSTNATPPTNAVWIRHSGNANPSDAIVRGKRLEVSATGGTPVSRQDDVHRFFPTTMTNSRTAMFASFVINATNLPNVAGTYFAHFQTNNTSALIGKLFAVVTNVSLPGTYRLGVSGAANAPNIIFPIDLALNQDYQVVFEWDPVTLWAAQLWINPISSSDNKVTSSDTILDPAQRCPVTGFGFRQASSFGNWFCTISNLVVADTFDEAATNVWATNAVAPTIILQPAAVTSNFVNSIFNLTAMAAGQGLSSMTYQWQKSATPDNAAPVNYDNPGGNTNVLAFIGAQTSDTGYYTLIATTPYGLSATSAIAKVVISAAPVPPSFLTQPASQSVYRGQTIVLSAVVSSPGNVAFTWYSNDVVVTAGQVDDLVNYSSTYTISNVQTNSSATYKVAVTNDVAVNGVVSTNAVLTVSNPSHVSVAYLRTLVDPGNGFAPTNSPPTIPYEVTGTITTYTNITSGNTASYYLQDGTGGINIFATFGSTFRPQQGDVVTFVGVLSSYATGLELYADPVNRPYTAFIDTGATNALPTPISIGYDVLAPNNITNVNLNIAGSLVKLTDVYFGANAGTLATNHIITVTNASGQSFSLQTFALDLDTLNQTFPAYAYSVSGILYGINTNFTIAVTLWADIVTNPPPPPPTIIPTNSAGVTGFAVAPGGNVVIAGTNAQATGVYYLLASTNVALPLNQWVTVATNVVNTNGNNGAFTFIGTNVVAPGGRQQFYILSNTNFNPQ